MAQIERINPEPNQHTKRSASLVECKACGWEWWPKPSTLQENGKPRICPKCKSIRWETGRLRAAHKKTRKPIIGD